MPVTLPVFRCIGCGHEPGRSRLSPRCLRCRCARVAGLASFLRKVWAVAAKDLRAELHGREVFSTMTVFSALAVLIFGMAFDLRVPDAAMVVPGVLWVIIMFAGVLGLNRSFGAETDRGTLPALLLAPWTAAPSTLAR